MTFKQKVTVLVLLNIFAIIGVCIWFRWNSPQLPASVQKERLGLLKQGTFSASEATVFFPIQAKILTRQIPTEEDVNALLSLMKGASPSQAPSVQEVRGIMCLSALVNAISTRPFTEAQKNDLCDQIGQFLKESQDHSGATLMIGIVCLRKAHCDKYDALIVPLLDSPDSKLRAVVKKYFAGSEFRMR